MSLQHRAAALEGDWLLLCGEVQQISSINRALDKALSLGVAQLKQQADTTGGPQLELADAMVYIVLAAASHCVSAASLRLCRLTVSLLPHRVSANQVAMQHALASAARSGELAANTDFRIVEQLAQRETQLWSAAFQKSQWRAHGVGVLRHSSWQLLWGKVCCQIEHERESECARV